MKITLNRAELFGATKRGESIAPHNSPLDVLRGLLLELDAANGTLTMTASNLEVTLEQKIPCTVPEDDALVVSARLTVDMLSRLPGDTVELERIPGKPVLYLRGGMAEYRVPVWERSSYPKLEIPFPEDTVLVSGIPGMAKRTVFAAAEDNSKPLLKCVNLKFTREGLRAAVGNGNCIVTVRGDEKSTGDISLLLPASSLERLAQLCGDKDEFRVGTTGKAIVFLRENFAYSARLLGGEYNRPLAKLGKAVKVADTSDQGKAKSKAISAVTVTFRQDTESFNEADGVFYENALSGNLSVFPAFLLCQRMLL